MKIGIIGLLAYFASFFLFYTRIDAMAVRGRTLSVERERKKQKNFGRGEESYCYIRSCILVQFGVQYIQP